MELEDCSVIRGSKVILGQILPAFSIAPTRIPREMRTEEPRATGDDGLTPLRCRRDFRVIVPHRSYDVAAYEVRNIIG